MVRIHIVCVKSGHLTPEAKPSISPYLVAVIVFLTINININTYKHMYVFFSICPFFPWIIRISLHMCSCTSNPLIGRQRINYSDNQFIMMEGINHFSSFITLKWISLVFGKRKLQLKIKSHNQTLQRKRVLTSNFSNWALTSQWRGPVSPVSVLFPGLWLVVFFRRLLHFASEAVFQTWTRCRKLLLYKSALAAPLLISWHCYSSSFFLTYADDSQLLDRSLRLWILAAFTSSVCGGCKLTADKLPSVNLRLSEQVKGNISLFSRSKERVLWSASAACRCLRPILF